MRNAGHDHALSEFRPGWTAASAILEHELPRATRVTPEPAGSRTGVGHLATTPRRRDVNWRRGFRVDTDRAERQSDLDCPLLVEIADFVERTVKIAPYEGVDFTLAIAARIAEVEGVFWTYAVRQDARGGDREHELRRRGGAGRRRGPEERKGHS